MSIFFVRAFLAAGRHNIWFRSLNISHRVLQRVCVFAYESLTPPQVGSGFLVSALFTPFGKLAKRTIGGNFPAPIHSLILFQHTLSLPTNPTHTVFTYNFFSFHKSLGITLETFYFPESLQVTFISLFIFMNHYNLHL